MRKLLASLLLVAAVLALPGQANAQGQKKEIKEQDLGKKESSITPDKSLAGDISREKKETTAAPTLQYDQYRIGVEMQVASKRQEQLESIKRIISYGPDKKEAPGLHFRYGELLWEESKYWFFEANRKDDDYIRAMNRQDKAAMAAAKAEKDQLLAKSKDFAAQAVEQYSIIVQQYKDFERTDEVLYFLGTNLMEQGEDKKALVAYKRLVEKYPKSKYIPDAQLAFGEYYFNNSKGKRDMLEKALAAYKEAAAFPESRIYGYALYKQGWCYFNMADYPAAKDMFKSVVLLSDLAKVDKDEKKKGSLAKEARTDFVRTYARDGSPTDAKAEFSKLAKVEEDLFTMMKQLANLYYEDGKDKEAALVFNTLIKQKPLSPEAPGWQGKIVDCVLRAGNKKMTVDQVRRLVKIHDDIVKRPELLKEEKDKKALDEARELSERTLSNLAVNWHNEAKKTRDEQTFFFANEVYGDYLTLFPESSKSYDLRFFWAELLNDNLQKFPEAAQQYTLVMLQDVKRMEGKSNEKDKDGKPVTKPGKYMTNAAYNAILAWDEVVKAAEQAGQIKSESSADNKPVKIPELKQNLLDACERYLKYVPNGDKQVEIAFKAANIYYRYNHFDEAVKRFAEMIEKNPDYKFENGDRAAEIAANLILDTYNLLGDWAKVNEWARTFYKNEKLATGKFKDDLSKVLEQSSFKLVNQLESNKEYAKAAEAYLTFVSEFPKSEIADKALFNASIDFYNAKMNDRAIQVRNNIIENYPKSEFVPQCIYANAEALESITDFEAAAKYYELYVSRWEKSTGKSAAPAKKAKGVKFSKKDKKKGKGSDDKAEAKPGDKQIWDEAKAQIALFNAGIFRDGLGQYAQALKNREKYLDLWGDSKDADAVFLSIADLHEKYSKYGKAIAQLEDYEKQNLKDPNKVLMCEGRIERLYATKLNKKKDSQRINKRVLDYYEKLSKKQKEALDGAAREAVGRAHFEKNADEYAFYAKMKLNWGSPATPNGVKKSIGEKVKSLEAVQKLYTETVKIKAADPAICALHQIGLAYVNMASALETIPIPKKIAVPGVGLAPVPPEMEDEIKVQFAQQAGPLKDKAAEAFAAAVQKSHELDVSNDCSQKSLALLRETYKPDQFPPVPEQIEEIKGHKSQQVGGDLLAALQPIPVVTASQLKENQQKAQKLKADTKDLKTDRPPDEDPVPREEVEPRGDDTPKGGAKQETKSGSEEPTEDGL